MLLYSRKKGRYRKDGYCWKKRRDGKTTREDHMKLKVGGTECIYGCYVHSAILPTFHRRCYWLLQNPDLVLVHYLNVPFSDESKTYLPSMCFLSDKLEWTKEELLEQLRPMFSCPVTIADDPTKQVRREQTLSSLVEQLLAAQKNAVEAKTKNPAPAYEACEICPKLALGIASNSISHQSIDYPIMMETLESPPTPSGGCNHTKNRLITPKGLSATPVSVANNVVNSVIPQQHSINIPDYSSNDDNNKGTDDSCSRSNGKVHSSQSPPSKKISDVGRQESSQNTSSSASAQRDPSQQTQQQQHAVENRKTYNGHDSTTVPPHDSITTTTELNERQRLFLLNKLSQGTSANQRNSLVSPEDLMMKDASQFPTTALDASTSVPLPSVPGFQTFFLAQQRQTNPNGSNVDKNPARFILSKGSNSVDLLRTSSSATVVSSSEVFGDSNPLQLPSADASSFLMGKKKTLDAECFQETDVTESSDALANKDLDVRSLLNQGNANVIENNLEELPNNSDCQTEGSEFANGRGNPSEDSSPKPPTFLFNLSPSCPSEIENLDIEMFGDLPQILSPDPNQPDLNCGLADSSERGFLGDKLFENNQKEKSPDHMLVDQGEFPQIFPEAQNNTMNDSVPNAGLAKKLLQIEVACPDSVQSEGSKVLIVLENDVDDTINLSGIECDFGGIKVRATIIKRNIIECHSPRHESGSFPLSLVLNGEKISNTVNFQFKEIEANHGNYKTIEKEQPEKWLEKYGYSRRILCDYLRSYFEFLSKTVLPSELVNKELIQQFDTKEEVLRVQILNFLKRFSQTKLQLKNFPSFMMHSGLKLSLLQIFATLGMIDIITLLLQWKKEENVAMSLLRQEDVDPQLCSVNGENALMWSCYMGHLEAAVLLSCWDWNTLYSVDFQERSAIDIAYINGHVNIAVFLQNLKDLTFSCKQAYSNPTLGTSDQQINSSFSSLSEAQHPPGVSSSSSAVFSFSSSFDSCPSDKCLACNGANCSHQSQRQESKGPSEKQTSATEPKSGSQSADNDIMPPPHIPSSEPENPNGCNQGGSSSGSESTETPSSKAERRRIIMRRLIKRLSAKSKAGQIDIPGPPAGALPPTRKAGSQETKSEVKQQGLKRQHEDRSSNQSSPLSPEQIKIQQHVVQLSQLQQQQVQHQKSLQQKPSSKQKVVGASAKSKEDEVVTTENEQSQTKDSIHHQLQILQQQIAAQQKQMQEVQKQQHQLILQQQEMMKKSSDGSQIQTLENADEQVKQAENENSSTRSMDCFLAPLNPKNISSSINAKSNIAHTEARSDIPSAKSSFNPNPLNLPDHLYALRDDEGNCYQNNCSDMNGEEASVYTLASQILEALPNHIKQQGAPLPPFSSADFRAKDINTVNERNISDIPTISMIAPPPPPLCSQNANNRFAGDRQNMKKLPDIWRFGEPQLEEDSFPEYGANDGNYCFGTYRDVPGTPRSAYSSYSSSLSPASSLQSPVSFAPIEYEDINPPSTAELNEFFTATSLDPNTTGLEAEDFSQLTLTDNEQRELYEAAKVIHSAYKKGGDCSEKSMSTCQTTESAADNDSTEEIEAAVTIQKYFRRYKTFMYYRQMNEAATRIQAQFRAYSEHKRFRRSRDAAVLIQSQYRTYREHKQFLASKQAAVVIQQRYRSHYRKRKQQQQQQLQQQQQNHVTQSGAGPTSTSMLAGYAKGSGIHHYHTHHSHMSHGASLTPNLQANLCSFPSHNSHQFHPHFSYPSTQNILPSNCVTAESPFSKIVVQHQPSSQQQHYASSAQSTMAAATAAAAAAAQCNFTQDPHENLNAVNDSIIQNNDQLSESTQEPFTSLSEFDLDSLPNLPANDSLFSDLY